MLSPVVVAAEVGRYQSISSKLKEDFAGIDDETLADTLEGLTGLSDLLGAVVRSSLEDDVMASALKARIGDMRARLERIEQRKERKRNLVCSAMAQAGLGKFSAEDFSVSLREGVPRLEVRDESLIPAFFLLPQPPKLDRAGLTNALKAGEEIAGVCLELGSPHIQVRTQ